MDETGGQRRGRRRKTAPAQALAAARYPARRGGLAALPQGSDVRHLALLVAGAPTGHPGRCGGPRPAAPAGGKIRRQIRGIQARNNGRWTNNYYDDMAWLALALERAGRLVGVEHRRALNTLEAQLVRAWVPEDGGGIPWRKQDQFFNAPANGPAGIFLARYGDRLRQAQQMADWIDRMLIDPETHLVFDGIKGGSLVRAQYTYCQGVVVGLETELAVRTGEDRHGQRVRRLVTAIAAEMAPTVSSRAPVAATAVCSPGSPRAILRWRPTNYPGTPMRTPTRARQPGDRARLRGSGVAEPADRRRVALVRGVLGAGG